MAPWVLKVLRFDSHYVAEGCGGGFGHACGVRVQKVQRVQRVQRVVVSPLRGDEYKDSVTCFPSRPHRHSKPKAKNLGMCWE